MKAIADETLLSRGVLPYDIEQTADLSNKKLSNVLSKIGFSLTCDNILNCSGVGTCKSLNYNWYDMCICPLNYAGKNNLPLPPPVFSSETNTKHSFRR